jgi:protein-S-isoprenylcysteine O-methyltransferase Ste14
MTLARLARLRVPLGFLSAAVAFWWARPTRDSLWIGMSIAAVGEVLRIWAAGHIEKGREITRSGPYRLVRHPLYLGSAIMGVGFIIASRSWVSGAIVAAYLVLTLTAAMRTEEARLDAHFEGAYSAYRTGNAPPQTRAFSLARAIANHEHRALAGFALAIGLLLLRMAFGAS